MRLRRLVYVGSLVLLLFCIQEGSPTLMLTSLIMALKGGLMVGKMSLGGLMMMLNAAQENQQSASVARQNVFAAKPPPTPFDILSLMSTSQSNNVPVATSAAPAKITTTPKTMTIMTTTPARFSKRRIIRKKIKVKRDVNEQTSQIEQKISNISISEANESPVQQAEVQRRLYRQISNLDPLMCLPKVMCGINSAPPSTKTTIMNDYAYLMKTIFTRDDDDEKKPVANDDKVATKKKHKKKNTDKNDDGADDDDTAEEDFALNDDDFERLALKEEEDIEALANDEMVDEEPGFLPFIMKDVHINNQRHKLPNADYPSDDLPQEGEYGEEDYYRQPPYEMSGRPPPSRPPPPHLVHKHSPEADKPQSSGSILSYLPKIGFGKNKEGSNDAFSSDPFFEGFKRSMRSNENGTTTLTKEQEEMLKRIAARRDKRDAYIQRKKKQLEMTSEPSEKFKIAAEVGQKLRSPRQCRALFNSCPFKYTEVLSMINNLRKAIQGQPEVTVQDQVQNLITKEAVQAVVQSAIQPQQQPAAPSKNVINVATGNGGHGITSISHQLPNGETVEINLKVLGQSTTTTTTTTEKATTAKTEAPKPTTKATRLPFTRPNDKEKVFDDDDERIYEHTVANAFDAASVASMRDRINSIESLESLKATILAIEKINNATLNRKKYGKPITYDGVFHEVTGLIPPKKRQPNEEPVHDSPGSSSESDEDDEVDEDLPLTKQNEVQITIRDPVTQKPIRLRPQVHQVPQERIRPKRPQPISTTTSRIPTNNPKRVVKYKTRKPTVSPIEIPAAYRNNSTYKITKVSQKKDPMTVVPFTEKENVMNPAIHKQPPPTVPVPTIKKPSGKDKEKEEEYDEEDVDGDENDNDTSEEEEEDEENDGDGDHEGRLNIRKTPNDTHEDDEEAEESTESRVVIKPSIQGHPPPQQMQGQHPDRHPHGPPPQQGPHPHGHPPQQGPHPHGHPPQQGPHSHGRPPPQLKRPHPDRHPHGPPPQQMQGPHPHRHPHGPPPPQLQGRRPQRHAKTPPTQFFRRTFHTYSGRGRSIDNEEPTSTEKPKHPNHRYPCGVDATTTEKTNEEKLQENQTPEESTTTSTQAPPTLPFRYPKYASPHKPITDITE